MRLCLHAYYMFVNIWLYMFFFGSQNNRINRALWLWFFFCMEGTAIYIDRRYDINGILTGKNIICFVFYFMKAADRYTFLRFSSRSTPKRHRLGSLTLIIFVFVSWSIQWFAAFTLRLPFCPSIFDTICCPIFFRMHGACCSTCSAFPKYTACSSHYLFVKQNVLLWIDEDVLEDLLGASYDSLYKYHIVRCMRLVSILVYITFNNGFTIVII